MSIDVEPTLDELIAEEAKKRKKSKQHGGAPCESELVGGKVGRKKKT